MIKTAISSGYYIANSYSWARLLLLQEELKYGYWKNTNRCNCCAFYDNLLPFSILNCCRFSYVIYVLLSQLILLRCVHTLLSVESKKAVFNYFPGQFVA